ncbi:MAG: hypothetical protein AAB920_02620 [Patescibacteria group bacterium]
MNNKYRQALEGMLLAFFGGPLVGYSFGAIFGGMYWLRYGANDFIYYHKFTSLLVGLVFVLIYHLTIEKIGLFPFVVFMLNFLPTFNIVLGITPQPIFIYISIALYVLTAYLYARELAQIKQKGSACDCNNKP